MSHMKYKIQLGRDRYHLHADMIRWCDQYIGLGEISTDRAKAVWDIEIVFGNSTYSFKRETDAAAFALRWA